MYDVTVEHNVAATMRDGTVLRADVPPPRYGKRSCIESVEPGVLDEYQSQPAIPFGIGRNGDGDAIRTAHRPALLRERVRSDRVPCLTTGSPNCSATQQAFDIPMLLSLYQAGELKFDELISQCYTLEEVNTGYDDLLTAGNIRGVITLGQD